MVATTVQDVRRFTPASYEGRDGAPVYLLGTLSFRERGRFRAAVSREGIRYPKDDEIARVMLEVLVELNPNNLATLTGHVEAFLDLLGEPALTAPADDASAEDKSAYKDEMARRIDIAKPYEDTLDVLRAHPRVAHLIAMRVLFGELAGPIAASFGLVGWESGPGTFRRSNGVVPDDVLDLLPDADLVAIGGEVLVMMTVSRVQRGNFASPSPSAGGQESSTPS